MKDFSQKCHTQFPNKVCTNLEELAYSRSNSEICISTQVVSGHDNLFQNESTLFTYVHVILIH